LPFPIPRPWLYPEKGQRLVLATSSVGWVLTHHP
jgi:hypothetical protein